MVHLVSVTPVKELGVLLEQLAGSAGFACRRWKYNRKLHVIR